MRPGEVLDIRLAPPSFKEDVEAMRATDIGRCHQCLTCTLGCPVAFAMDYRPHQLIRMVQLGLKERVLSSSAIWLCATCESCATRCPNEVRIVQVMDALRQMAVQERVDLGDESLALFHHAFLEGIKRWGRQYELGLVLKLKLRTKDLFSDIGLGLKLLTKGRLKLLPHRSAGAKQVSALFEKAAGGKS